MSISSAIKSFQRFLSRPKAHHLFLYGVFLLSLWLILRNNHFYSGDVAIVHTMNVDAANFDLRSWYFYGQAYFGNLHVVLYAPLYWLFGQDFANLEIYEHVIFWLSGYLLFTTISKPHWLTTFIFSFGFFFLNRFSFYSFAHTYPFVVLLLVISYRLTRPGFTRYFYRAEAFSIGLLTSLSLWHNPIYLPIIGVYAVALFRQISFAETTPTGYWQKQLGSATAGLGLGIIPLWLAARSTMGENLAWFESNQAAGSVFDSIYYWVREVLLYYVPGRPYATLGEIWRAFADRPNLVLTQLALPLICLGLGSFAVFFICRNYRRYPALLLWISCISILLFRKNVGSIDPLFTHGRYLFFLHPFLWLAIGQTINSYLRKVTLTWSKAAISMTAGCVLVFTLSEVLTNYTTIYQGQHAYQYVYTELEPYEVEYLYCQNFYDPCYGLYVTTERDWQVQILEDSLPLARNPHTVGVVDRAFAEGETVYALTPIEQDHVDRTEVLEKFQINGTEYEFYQVTSKKPDAN